MNKVLTSEQVESVLKIYNTAKCVTEWLKPFRAMSSIAECLENLGYRCYNFSNEDEFFDFEYGDVCMTYNHEHGLETQIQIFIEDYGGWEDFNIVDIEKIEKEK